MKIIFFFYWFRPNLQYRRTLLEALARLQVFHGFDPQLFWVGPANSRMSDELVRPSEAHSPGSSNADDNVSLVIGGPRASGDLDEAAAGATRCGRWPSAGWRLYARGKAQSI